MAQYATFHVGHLHLGVPVEAVQEVLQHQDLTPVPLAPPAVAGLMNLRGQIVTAIALRHRLGLPATSADDQLVNVVLSTEDGPVSLQVDGIDGVLAVDGDQLEAPPATLGPELRGLITGVCRLPDRLLLTLDAQRVTYFTGTAA